MKGKIFNTQEIQAIIARNKTMFREVCKKQDGIFLSGENGSISWHKDLPKFQVGQEIFVKEPFNIFCSQLVYKFSYKKNDRVFWMPASRMKQEHSRIRLKIKSVKVERLQDISEEDCIKEGIGYTGGWNGEDYDDGEYYFGKLTESEEGIIEHTTEMFQFCDRFACKNEMFEYAEDAFEAYWNSTQKKQEHEWEANPWVFVYEFEVIKN